MSLVAGGTILYWLLFEFFMLHPLLVSCSSPSKKSNWKLIYIDYYYLWIFTIFGATYKNKNIGQCTSQHKYSFNVCFIVRSQIIIVTNRSFNSTSIRPVYAPIFISTEGVRMSMYLVCNDSKCFLYTDICILFSFFSVD